MMLIPNEGQVRSQEINAMSEEIILLTYNQSKVTNTLNQLMRG